MKLRKVRATTAEWASGYPWHFGGSIPAVGPILGIDRLAGGRPFGLDPLGLVDAGIATNPNMVVAGAPGNGKSAFVKSMLWTLVGAFGYRFVVTDVKGEYRAIAEALGVPTLDLRPGGTTRVNPLQNEKDRLEFVEALGALCVDRSLNSIERTALREACKLLPAEPVLSDLLNILREFPEEMCQEMVIERTEALSGTQPLRFGLGELLTGSLAGMFNGPSTVTTPKSGFVVDVSGCGTDDRVLRFAMLAGQRAVSQMLAESKHRTIRVNDEGWRLMSTLEGARYTQADFKLGRNDALANILVVHRFSEIGGQAEGVTSQIASKLVADADLHVIFRQGDHSDIEDCVERLQMPAATRDALAAITKHRCLVHLKGSLALLQVELTDRMRTLADTNSAIRGPHQKSSENVA